MVCFHPERRVIFIHIPKTGGLSCEVLLIKQFGFQRFTFDTTSDPYPFLRDSRGKIGILRYLLKYSRESKIYDFSTFRKIGVVRDPYERCESAVRYLHKSSRGKYKFPMNMKDFYYTSLDRHYYYMHFCLTQKRSLEDLDGNIDMECVCRFTHLFEDLARILFDICGFERQEIKQIHINKSDKDILQLNPQEMRLLITKIHYDDFDHFGFERDPIELSELDFIFPQIPQIPQVGNQDLQN